MVRGGDGRPVADLQPTSLARSGAGPSASRHWRRKTCFEQKPLRWRRRRRSNVVSSTPTCPAVVFQTAIKRAALIPADVATISLDHCCLFRGGAAHSTGVVERRSPTILLPLTLMPSSPTLTRNGWSPARALVDELWVLVVVPCCAGASPCGSDCENDQSDTPCSRRRGSASVFWAPASLPCDAGGFCSVYVVASSMRRRSRGTRGNGRRHGGSLVRVCPDSPPDSTTFMCAARHRPSRGGSRGRNTS